MTMTEKNLSYREKRMAELAERRAKRTTPIGPSFKLSVPEEYKRPDYEYRWVNDDDKGNVNVKTNIDTWDFVTSDEIADDPRNSSGGSRIERVVGNNKEGKPLKAYLVCKPRKWWAEDRARKMQAHEEIMSQIQRREGPVPLAAGEADLSADAEHAYVPRDARLPESKAGELGLRRR